MTSGINPHPKASGDDLRVLMKPYACNSRETSDGGGTNDSSGFVHAAVVAMDV